MIIQKLFLKAMILIFLHIFQNFLSFYFLGSVQYDQENCKQYEAHPKANCKEFIFCSGVIRYIMTCGAGTVFNPKNKACDHPDNVKCPEKKSSKYAFFKLIFFH